MTSTHWVTAVFRRAVWQSYFCGIWELLFRIPLKTMAIKEISAAKSEKEAFWETSLRSANSPHRVTAFPSRSLSLRLFLCNWQSDIWNPIEGYGETGNILRKNWEESLWETALCSVNSSHRVTAFLSRSISRRLFLLILQSDIWKSREVYGEIGNIFC